MLYAIVVETNFMVKVKLRNMLKSGLNCNVYYEKTIEYANSISCFSHKVRLILIIDQFIATRYKRIDLSLVFQVLHWWFFFFIFFYFLQPHLGSHSMLLRFRLESVIQCFNRRHSLTRIRCHSH